MKILAFDTSSVRLTAGIYDGQRLLAASVSEGDGRHSGALVPVLEKLLKKARVPVRKVECIAVGLGPGSFTGLRIALTTAKLLSYALGARLIGISSLEACVRGQKEEGDYAVVLDAKRGQIYAAVYRLKKGRWSALRKPALFVREDFLKSLGASVKILDSALPDAAKIAEAALERIASKKFDDPFSLEPAYLRPKDCNVTPRKK